MPTCWIRLQATKRQRKGYSGSTNDVWSEIVRRLLLAAAALASGCADPASDPATQAPEVVESPIVASNDATPTSTPVATAETDQCGAADHQWLVGENRSRIPEEPAGATWRITCTGCPVTQDYSPQRMNILFDQETDIVTSVSCG